MIQKIYIPQDRRLRQLINFLSYVAFTPEDKIEGWTAIFPNATSNLVVSLAGKINFNNSAADSSLYASCSSTVAMLPQNGMCFMAVQFNSFGVYYIRGIPASEMQDTMLPLEVFFKASAIQTLTQQLLDEPTIEDKFKALEAFLCKNLGTSDIDPRLPFAISTLKSGNLVSMDELTDAVCLSGRGLQKLFKKCVGMSPAYYKRIARFNRAANMLMSCPNTPLTTIALECDYFDQAHFIKDFRHFGGITPSDFLKLQAKSSDFYNYNLKDIGNLALS